MGLLHPQDQLGGGGIARQRWRRPGDGRGGPGPGVSGAAVECGGGGGAREPTGGQGPERPEGCGRSEEGKASTTRRHKQRTRVLGTSDPFGDVSFRRCMRSLGEGVGNRQHAVGDVGDEGRGARAGGPPADRGAEPSLCAGGEG